MEKMSQSLLGLRCQTFLEKAYLRNSALSPGAVGRQGRVPARLGARSRGQRVLSRRFHPRFPHSQVFFPKKWSFLSMCYAGENTCAAFCSDGGGRAGSGEAAGPSMGIPTSSVTAGDLSALSSHSFSCACLVHRKGGALGLFP